MISLELWLYLALLLISIILVALSLRHTEHSELGIVGFTFIFVLSFVMIQGDIQYKVGQNETITYSCLCCEQGGTYECDDNSSMVATLKERVDVYENFTAGGPLSRSVGYWLAVMAVIGFIGVFVGLKTEGFMEPK